MIMDLAAIALLFGKICVPILVLLVIDFLGSIVLMYFLQNWVNQLDAPEEAKGMMMGAVLYLPAIILLPVTLLTEPTFKTSVKNKLQL